MINDICGRGGRGEGGTDTPQRCGFLGLFVANSRSKYIKSIPSKKGIPLSLRK